ncbi:hypothetical protein [Streptomyces sp. NPDC056069]|uniref:hypothetical protein n=1 Tax=Streptomyces sp. NPDC056069 TaxID=3345702 RepID=UPI0035DAED97
MTADEAYGQEWKFRRLLEELGVGYVVAMPKSQQVKSLAGFWRIDRPGARGWQFLRRRRQGSAVYDGASARLPAISFFDGDTPAHHRWVLARRSLHNPHEIAC